MKEQIIQSAKDYFYKAYQVADQFVDCPKLQYQKRMDIKNIALYYHKLDLGGVERVIVQLSAMLSERYRVIVVTDTEPSGEDFDLNARVTRVTITDRGTAAKDYTRRYEDWKRIIEAYELDAVLYSGWMEAVLFWDLLSIKSHDNHPAFVIHTHGFCCRPYRNEGNTARNLSWSYRLADGVVTLSQTDQAYTSCFNPNVTTIMNPVELTAHENNYKETEPVISWVGRFSWEKQPLEAIKVLKEVVKVKPEVQLYLIGAGEEDITEKMIREIKELHLEHNVVMTGFTKEVDQFYQKTTLLLGTSLFEGSPMTFYEALSWQIPIVTYDLPWVSVLEDGRGVRTAAQGNTKEMAEVILEVLQNREILEQLRRGAAEHFQELKETDLVESWSRYLQRLNENKIQQESPVDLKKLQQVIPFLCEYQQIGKENLLNKLQKTYDEKAERGLRIKELEAKIREMENDHIIKEEIHSPKEKWTSRLFRR